MSEHAAGATRGETRSFEARARVLRRLRRSGCRLRRRRTRRTRCIDHPRDGLLRGRLPEWYRRGSSRRTDRQVRVLLGSCDPLAHSRADGLAAGSAPPIWIRASQAFAAAFARVPFCSSPAGRRVDPSDRIQHRLRNSVHFGCGFRLCLRLAEWVRFDLRIRTYAIEPGRVSADVPRGPTGRALPAP